MEHVTFNLRHSFSRIYSTTNTMTERPVASPLDTEDIAIKVDLIYKLLVQLNEKMDSVQDMCEDLCFENDDTDYSSEEDESDDSEEDSPVEPSIQ